MNATHEMTKATKFHNVRIFSASLVESPTVLQDLRSVATHWSLPTSSTYVCVVMLTVVVVVGLLVVVAMVV